MHLQPGRAVGQDARERAHTEHRQHIGHVQSEVHQEDHAQQLLHQLVRNGDRSERRHDNFSDGKNFSAGGAMLQEVVGSFSGIDEAVSLSELMYRLFIILFRSSSSIRVSMLTVEKSGHVSKMNFS